MKTLLLIVVVQSLNLIVFLWFNRVAWIRILALKQQLVVYKRNSKKPRLRNSDRLFWSLPSKSWRDWASELILVFIRRISSDHPEYGEDRITLEWSWR